MIIRNNKKELKRELLKCLFNKHTKIMQIDIVWYLYFLQNTHIKYVMCYRTRHSGQCPTTGKKNKWNFILLPRQKNVNEKEADLNLWPLSVFCQRIWMYISVGKNNIWPYKCALILR